VIDLIYCANGSPKFAKIAIDAGYSYGAQLPGHVPFPLAFADQNWKKPDRGAYITALTQHRPQMASVLDWERPEQLSEVLAWAEDAAQFVDTVMLIPKVPGGIDQLPRIIGGKPVRLGFSIPTRHGGTAVWPGEFHGWPIHLLGGSPQAQMKWRSRMTGVASADGNYHHKMATINCQFWQPGNATYAVNRWWPTLVEADGARWGDGTAGADAPYEAFRRSCINIMEAWRAIDSGWAISGTIQGQPRQLPLYQS
jgi:hypothetical protein